MDPYDYYYEESSTSGHPNTYQERRYEPQYAASRGYEPSQSYRAPQLGYGYGARNYNEASYYDPSPLGYNSSPPDFYGAPQPDYYVPRPSEFYPPPQHPTTVDSLESHREILASTNESLASLSSTIDEFQSWGLIPIPSVLQATLNKFDSSVVTFLDLELSQVPFARYRSFSASIIKASTRIEMELKNMVERFISLKNMGFTVVYDGTQPLDTSEDFDELVIKEIPLADDVGLHSTMPKPPFEKWDEEAKFIEYFVEYFISEEIEDVVLGVGESRNIHNDRADDILEEVEPRERELGDVGVPFGEIEPIVEDVDFPLEVDTEPVHYVLDAPDSANDVLVGPVPFEPSFDVIPDDDQMAKMALKMRELNSACSTIDFIYPEADYAALERKILILFLACVDGRARRHKNAAMRATYTRLNSNVPSQPILESTKAWYEKHFFLDPG